MIHAKYIPLTFITERIEKERLIRNTMLLQQYAGADVEETSLSHYIEISLVGSNFSCGVSPRILDLTDSIS